MNDLLIEIGTEEIPAGYIEPALESFSSMLLKKLSEYRIEYKDSRIYGAPRRLAIHITDLSDKQAPVITEITGPPQRIGFDENGKPTKAAKKFAEKAGVDIDEIKIKETKKGSYLSAEKKDAGVSTQKVLAEILPKTVLSIPFPKTMRWGDLSIEFARPIQYILAILGNTIIPWDTKDIKTGNLTRGHYFMHPDMIEISAPDQYVEKLRKAYVLVDIKERKLTIEKEISSAASKTGGKILPDPDLIKTVTNLVEYPVVATGSFDTKYLELPDEVLTTSMREHQKYFSVINDEQKLIPYFIVVNNTLVKDIKLVVKGHERVLRSRLEDAMFFFKADLKISFETRIESLKNVLFQRELGTIYDKIKRVQQTAELLADLVGADLDAKKHISRAAWLSKADLVSQVVVEFPKLQGIMGRIYAGKQGEDDQVAQALEEHYMPTRSGGSLPESTIGSVISIADKIDTICGCFCAGLQPTGTSDPHGLRRQGIGIIHIILNENFTFSIKQLIDEILKTFEKNLSFDFSKTSHGINNFFQDRLTNILIDEGFAKDTIAATLSACADSLPDLLKRIRALKKLRAEPDFEQIAITFKRVVNIINKSKKEKTDINSNPVNQTIFDHPSESHLYAEYKKIKSLIFDHMEKGEFSKALYDMAKLRKPVDDFFDNVMVMDNDLTLRTNRLALLSEISSLFGSFADFLKIAT